MTKYLVTKKGASAFASAEGTFPVAPDGTVELPDNGQLVCELAAEGVIVAIPAVEEVKTDESAPETVEEDPSPRKRAKKAA
jgi:hypothetical protein